MPFGRRRPERLILVSKSLSSRRRRSERRLVKIVIIDAFVERQWFKS